MVNEEMRKLITHLITALVSFLLGFGIFLICMSRVEDVALVEPEPKLRLSIPDSRWVPALFRFIDERAAEAHLPKLRATELPDGDMEVRIWAGFGQNGEDGLVLRRSAGHWSGEHLHGMFERYPPAKFEKALEEPKSGWDKAWQRLVGAGLLTLPDASEVGCNTFILDGMVYVVEINMDKSYRTYMYDNPAYAKCVEAKRMIEIGRIIDEEFNLGEFRIVE